MINYDSESRLRAIAINAVREAMLVYGRFDKQFMDDDAARAENIFQILHLATDISDYEHAPLIADTTAKVTDQARKIADILGNLSFDEEPKNSIPEAIAVKANLPKATPKAVNE